MCEEVKQRTKTQRGKLFLFSCMRQPFGIGCSYMRKPPPPHRLGVIEHWVTTHWVTALCTLHYMFSKYGYMAYVYPGHTLGTQNKQYCSHTCAKVFLFVYLYRNSQVHTRSLPNQCESYHIPQAQQDNESIYLYAYCFCPRFSLYKLMPH